MGSQVGVEVLPLLLFENRIKKKLKEASKLWYSTKYRLRAVALDAGDAYNVLPVDDRP